MELITPSIFLPIFVIKINQKNYSGQIFLLTVINPGPNIFYSKKAMLIIKRLVFKKQEFQK